MKRPKTPRPARWNSTGSRRVIPEAVRDAMASKRYQLAGILDLLHVIHGNYGLGDYSAEYDDLYRLWKRLAADLDGTTTERMERYKAVQNG